VGIFLAILAGLLLGGVLVYFWQKPYADNLRQELRVMRHSMEERSRLIEIELQERTRDKQVDFQRHLNTKVEDLTDQHRSELAAVELGFQNRLTEQAEDLAQQYQAKIRDLQEAHRLEVQKLSLWTGPVERGRREVGVGETGGAVGEENQVVEPVVPLKLSEAGLPLQGSFGAGEMGGTEEMRQSDAAAHLIGDPTRPMAVSQEQARQIQARVTEADVALMVEAELSQMPPVNLPPVNSATSAQTSTAPKNTPNSPCNISQLIASVANADSTTRQQIAQHLGQLGKADQSRTDGRRVMATLIQLSRDAAAPVRQTAVQALGSLRSPKVIPHLKRALRDVNPAVVQAAHEAIAPFKLRVLPQQPIKVKRRINL
jgi:HEAT repeats